MSNLMPQSIAECFHHFTEYIGFPKDGCVLIEDANADRDLSLNVRYLISRRSAMAGLDSLADDLNKISSSIAGSQLIRDRVRDPLEKRILELEIKCKELEKLIPYKQHFDIEMALRHGPIIVAEDEP